MALISSNKFLDKANRSMSSHAFCQCNSNAKTCIYGLYGT